MEDHRDAYFFWKELGLSEHTCIHVDAHLDVSDLKAPGCEVTSSPEINCGNFLLPALNEGIVSSLVWVIPEHLPGGQNLLDWTRQELQNWLHLELGDYMSLVAENERVTGTLLGKPFTVCFSRDLPPMDGPVLLDIDIDYYLGPQDEIWQSPLELAVHLNGVQPGAVTVAYSIEGGYTPLRHRFLGPLTELALRDPEAAREVWTDPPAAQGPEEARPIDLLSGALMRGRFEEARRYLEQVVNPAEARFMDGMIAFRQREFESAVERWSQLLSEAPLEPQTRLYLLTFCGRALIEVGQYDQARRVLAEARGIDRRDSEVSYLLARAMVGMGDLEEGGRLYRKAIKLAPERLETVEVKLELAEVYLRLGRAGLADRMLVQVVRGNTPGFMKLRAEALKLKLALGTTT